MEKKDRETEAAEDDEEGSGDEDPKKEKEKPEAGEAEEEADSSESRRGPLATLKEYKEFIGIMVFFLSGAIWIYTTFATKLYVARMQCLLGATISRLDNEAQSRVFLAEIIDHNVKMGRLKKAEAQADYIVEIETESEKIKDLTKKKSLADDAAKKASLSLGECDK